MIDNLDLQLRAIQRRQAIVRCHPEILIMLSRGRYEVGKNALPDDARVVGSYYDWQRNSFCIIIESEALPPTPIDVALPELPPVMVRRLNDS